MSHSLHDGTTAPLWSALAVFRRVGVQRFTAVDIVTLVYVTFATAAVLAFSREDHASWDLLLTAHALVVVLVLIAPRAREAGAVGRFLGDWYPMVLLAGLYAEVGVVNVDLGVQHDQIIVSADVDVTDVDLRHRAPTCLLQHFHSASRFQVERPFAPGQSCC